MSETREQARGNAMPDYWTDDVVIRELRKYCSEQAAEIARLTVLIHEQAHTDSEYTKALEEQNARLRDAIWPSNSVTDIDGLVALAQAHRSDSEERDVAEAEIARLTALVAELEQALTDAVTELRDALQYKGDYLRVKHDDDAEVARFEAVLRRAGAEKGQQ